MGKLINIDNGGTLTDVCVLDGDRIWRTKTLTTPYDLSKCFLAGLAKASKLLYGEEDVVSLLASTDRIRYSTTQGTNALVERKGPLLGLVATGSLDEGSLLREPGARALFDAIVGGRIAGIDLALEGEAFEHAAVRAVNALASAGASRIIVAHGGADRLEVEARIRRVLLHKFPQHLLGAVPILYSHEIAADDDDTRRTWTALFNAFLHPAMERFLYNADHQLQERKAQTPLLVFRNDGHSARVAKTIALKTYSSGPRGGMEGARALARHYGFDHLVSVDVGGTTTDVGEVRGGEVREERRGRVEGLSVSYPLCHLVSAGVGGSSIHRIGPGGAIVVGPDSVGSTPGPACFGLGGTEATITDAFLVLGLLDPRSFFGGELALDPERARAAISDRIAKPLGTSVEDAAACMEDAWVARVAKAITDFTKIDSTTTLAAFGGAGALVVCRIAEAIGSSRVLIPGLAAVFSAFGLGFSGVAHELELPVDRPEDQGAVAGRLENLARRAMFAEGFALEDCRIERRLMLRTGEKEEALDPARPIPVRPGARAWLALSVSHPLPEPKLVGTFGGEASAAVSRGERRTIVGGRVRELPLYRTEEQPPRARGEGPAILEEAFFTGRIDAGWRFETNDAGDVLLTRGAQETKA